MLPYFLSPFYVLHKFCELSTWHKSREYRALGCEGGHVEHALGSEGSGPLPWASGPRTHSSQLCLPNPKQPRSEDAAQAVTTVGSVLN